MRFPLSHPVIRGLNYTELLHEVRLHYLVSACLASASLSRVLHEKRRRYLVRSSIGSVQIMRSSNGSVLNIFYFSVLECESWSLSMRFLHSSSFENEIISLTRSFFMLHSSMKSLALLHEKRFIIISHINFRRSLHSSIWRAKVRFFMLRNPQLLALRGGPLLVQFLYLCVIHIELCIPSALQEDFYLSNT
jgi:hypothetical protein